MTSRMMILCLVLAALCFALPSSEARRLLLGDDGFARVDGTSSTIPATGITVSSWVNITEFPGGVAPLVTLISEDASYQIAFFVRHDGAGVLWGGPAGRQQPPPQDDYVDRHPRSRFGNGRKRRNAVDYSMGLGNVMNIMSPRKERSNTWTPMNFVDVSEMGVADLETSGSNTNNHYENWYDVGYELQMQESADPEPRIITQPSGENDFVVINWNRQNTPPLSSNQWDPVNEEELYTPEIAPPQLPTKVRAPENERFVWSQEENDKEGGWSSQVIPIDAEVKVPSNTRNFIPTTPRETTTTTTTTTVKPASNKSRQRKRPTRPFVPDLRRPSGSENVNSYRPAPEGFRYNTRRRQSTTTTSTTSTTTKRPLHVSHEVVRNSQESRVPLWARLKNTASEEELISSEPETTTETPTTTTRVPARTASPITRIQIPTAQRKPVLRSTTTPEPEIQTQRPPVTSTRAPVPIIREETEAPTTTSKPTEAIIKTKPPRRFRASNEVKDRKTYSNLNAKITSTRKPYTQTRNNRPLTSHTLDEFKRVLEGKPAIEDTGNKVVVYSMPITDVDAFNRMYEQYQETESKQNPRVNLHVVYEQAREGEEIPIINEDESNQNRIEQVPEPMPILTYKEEPLHFAEQDSEPVVVVEEEEAMQEQPTEEIVIVEEPLPAYDDSSFRPLSVDNPYATLETDYSSYYPYVQKAEPVMVSTLNDHVPEAAINQFRIVEVPLSEQSDILEQQRPVLYDSAVPAEQDIGGQRPGFYQEPSRISHEQLPPEYTQKPQKENKRVFDGNTKIASNENSNIRPNVHSQTLRLPRPIEAVEPQEVVYSSPEVVRQNIPNQDFLPRPIHSAERPRLSEEMIRKIQLHNVQPITIGEPTDVRVEEEIPQSVPIQESADVPAVDTNTPEILQEVPLNVNFRKMPYNFDLNTWYHVTFSWSSFDHVLRIYINGQLAGILEDTIPDKQVLPTQGMVLLGKTLLPSLTGFDPTSHLSGEMSNFVVWGEALSPSEVNDVFTCGPSPSHPVLLAWNKTPLRVYNDAVVEQAPPICGISS